MKKKIGNRAKVLAAVGLLAILGIGGIRAFMTDHEAAANKFTVGKVDFNLYEEAWDGELPDGSYIATPSDALGIHQAEDIYSGKVINKNPAVKNNSKNDAYLRMRVKVPVADVVTAFEDGTVKNGGVPMATELFTFTENTGTGMRRVPGTPTVEVATPSGADPSERPQVYHVYEYEYTGNGDTEIPLPAGQDIPPLFDQVMFANVIEGQVDEAIEFIKVDFRAIQSGGFNSPEEAWATYSRQNPHIE